MGGKSTNIAKITRRDRRHEGRGLTNDQQEAYLSEIRTYVRTGITMQTETVEVLRRLVEIERDERDLRDRTLTLLEDRSGVRRPPIRRHQQQAADTERHLHAVE